MITLECNYSKKIGLLQYSSRQFSITLKAEIADVSQVQSESARLYQLLQDGVDSSIQKIGFLPSPTNNGNGHSPAHTNGNGDAWKCSPKQKELILKIIGENRLEKSEVEQLAKDRFNTPVKLLNKLQAFGLIKKLIEKYPGKESSQLFNRKPYQKGGAR